MDENDIARAFGKQIEEALFKAMMGTPRKQPQTALRVTSWGTLETVELDDDGKVRICCNCGAWSVLHRLDCQFALACT